MFEPPFSYFNSMKKCIGTVILLGALLPALTACGEYDYTAHISEERSDLFCAQTDEFSLTLSCVLREYPYVSDGVPCDMTKSVEITLTDAQGAKDYSVYLLGGEKEIGGEMSFRNVRGDYYYSQGVEVFPEASVTLRVEWGEESREITATSVKNEKTLTTKQALSSALAAEQETLKSMTDENGFYGEFYVRLLRRDKNYYYVGIIDKTGATVSILLDSESGEVLARRVTDEGKIR